ncbi:type IV secretion system DNA-binding domain-containing protein [Caulobacter segnis]|uniref:type IV secretory system conjugative DNA transfer family protein n=1 Tax=Caulobacter segnis TaxID=88688 RepID=UPI00285C7434|nr:type IV secretion system DNA-binding domain-containing protein [Caulobacter segnis]MDR6624837.1 hypothetical protein [Caulobacter segnis]
MGLFDGWFESGLERELRETREGWDLAQAALARTPVGRDGVALIALSLLGDLHTLTGRLPASTGMMAMLKATSDLLDLEEIGPIEPLWPLIESDMSAAVDFRRMTAHRLRWAREFDARHMLLRTHLLPVWRYIQENLPERCFDENAGDALFEIPLIELIDRPAILIEHLTRFTYAADLTRAGLFTNLRQRLERNLLVASGMPATASLTSAKQRLVWPGAARDLSPTELSERYLAGTPFTQLLEMPVPFQVNEETRFEHCHVVGGSGHGKTQFLQRMIHADLLAAQREKRSVVVIDSQGDMISRLLRLDLFSPDHPESLADRLVLIDPADVEFPASLNLFDVKLDRLAAYRPVDQERVLNGVVELYETFFGALLGAELTQKQGVIFKYLARLLLTVPNATIHTLMQLMEDGRPFKPYMEKLDGSARYFFQTEFFQPSFAATKKQILRRLWGVLATPAFERMFAQTKNKLDLFQAMQDGKIILVSTAKDLLKQEGSQLFGRFFIAMLAQAALERSTVAAPDRTPTYVYVDEAQEYFDDTVETILNQARKYRVSLTVAHQALDQLSPRLRAIFHANTAMKCAGGVSAKDARAFADELHTTADFIEGMKRGRGRTEFAAWIRHQTPQALRLSIPLGHVERQPTLTEEQFDTLLARNRERYCGTLTDIPVLSPASTFDEPPPTPRPTHPPPTEPPSEPVRPAATAVPETPTQLPPPPPPREAGKGGQKHRYLQSLVKELGEQQGFRAVVEAPLPDGGQVDVLLTRDGMRAAFEVSVSTPAAWEQENVRKCLAAGYERVALVLAKSPRTQGTFRATITEGLSAEDRERVSFLAPEDLPDYITGLAPPPEPTETMVKGYRVRVSQTTVSPEEARLRREQLAAVIARSMAQN